MRAHVLVAGVTAVVALAACSSSKHTAPPAPTTVASTTTTTTVEATTTLPASTSSTSVRTTSTTVAPVSCARLPVPGAPVVHTAAASSYLTTVGSHSDDCLDHVTFGFTAASPAVPGYGVTYTNPPFVQQASGAPVAVAGRVFILVKLQPAYTYNFESGTPTYTGPRNIVVRGAHCVRAIVETGDNEGVVTWIIGLDAPRGFTVTTTKTPRPQLIVTIG
jgi:hypothetical protein